MKIRIAPALLLFLLLQAVNGRFLLFATLIAALFHECGHLLAAALQSIPIRLMEIDLFGAKIHPRGLITSYKKEILLAVAGPAFSLLLGVFLLPHSGIFAQTLKASTLSLALFNLLPIGEFDGGRVLHATLCLFLPQELADRVLAVTSYLFLLLLFSLASCMLLRHGQNLVLTILCASLFARIFLL